MTCFWSHICLSIDKADVVLLGCPKPVNLQSHECKHICRHCFLQLRFHTIFSCVRGLWPLLDSTEFCPSAYVSLYMFAVLSGAITSTDRHWRNSSRRIREAVSYLPCSRSNFNRSYYLSSERRYPKVPILASSWLVHTSELVYRNYLLYSPCYVRLFIFVVCNHRSR